MGTVSLIDECSLSLSHLRSLAEAETGMESGDYNKRKVGSVYNNAVCGRTLESLQQTPTTAMGFNDHGCRWNYVVTIQNNKVVNAWVKLMAAIFNGKKKFFQFGSPEIFGCSCVCLGCR